LWSALERREVPARGASFACQGVERLIGVFEGATVDDAVVRRALELGWPDFEDAVCAAAALAWLRG